MADSKISDLPSYASRLYTDLSAIVDVTTTTTKKITYQALFTNLATASKIIATASSGFFADYYTDGVADDVQIQAAIDAVNSAGGGLIVIRAGTYSTSNYILMRSNVNIFGEGEATVLNIGAAAHAGITNRDPTLGANLLTVVSNCKLQDFKLNAGALSSQEIGIGFYNAQNIEVSRIHSNAVGFCVFFGNFTTARGGTQDTKRIWVHHNFLQGICSQDIVGGGQTFEPSDWAFQDIIVEQNYISHDRNGSAGTDTNAFDMVSVSNLILRGNVVDGNLLFGNEKSPHVRSTIEGNIIRPPLNSTERCAIMIEDNAASHQSGNLKVVNNEVQSGQIWITGSSGQHILGAVVLGNIVTQSSTINNAGILGFSSDGIRIRYVDRAQISSNYMDGGGTTSSGVLIDNSLNNSVNDNKVYNHTTGLKEQNTTSGNSFNDNDIIGATTPLSLAADAVAFNNKGANPQKLFAQGNITGATTFNRVNGNVITGTFVGNVTTTVLTSGSVVGDELTLILTQDATGSRTFAKPSNALLVGGAFSPSSGAGAVDNWTLRWNGTNWVETNRSLNVS